jgi:hypothetical protein
MIYCSWFLNVYVYICFSVCAPLLQKKTLKFNMNLTDMRIYTMVLIVRFNILEKNTIKKTLCIYTINLFFMSNKKKKLKTR